jgi:outer membrane protein OmpA-like peptidoglycan-associated protein
MDMMALSFNRWGGWPVIRIRTKQALGALLLAVLAACAPQASGPSMTEDGRYLIYFDEFSARITPEARQVIATAAQRVRELGVKTVRIEGRASATGSPAANQHLTETRTQVVYDELQKDGVDPTIIQQQPLGQTGSGDTGVTDRRVDVVLLK